MTTGSLTILLLKEKRVVEFSDIISPQRSTDVRPFSLDLRRK